jgi:hypothetical protein
VALPTALPQRLESRINYTALLGHAATNAPHGDGAEAGDAEVTAAAIGGDA